MAPTVNFVYSRFSLLAWIRYTCTCVGRYLHMVGISRNIFADWNIHNCIDLFLNKINERKLNFKNLFRLYF